MLFRSVSVASLPVVVHHLGISTWQEIISGQGIGLILAEVVDGGWVSLGPKLLGPEGSGSFNFRASLRERFTRFIICVGLGLGLIQLLQFHNALVVSISFLSWITTGINIHWLSIASGVANYSRDYVVVPRIIGQIIGIGLLFFYQSTITYLLLQLLFSFLPLVISIFRFAHRDLSRDLKIELPKNRSFIVIGNIFRSSTIWIIIVCGTSLYKTDFAGFAAIFKYLDIFASVSLVINQSNHALMISEKGTTGAQNSQLHSIIFSVVTFFLSLGLWPLAEKLLFSNQVQIDLVSAFFILCVIPFRALLYHYLQDYLIPSERYKTATVIYSVQPFIAILILIIINTIGLRISLFPYLFVTSFIAIFLCLSIMDSFFRKFLMLLKKSNS